MPIWRAPGAPQTPATRPLERHVLASEAAFYGYYHWSLNALFTVGALVKHLSEELRRAAEVEADWRLEEVLTNIFLLSCGLCSAVDDHLHGPLYDFSKLSLAVPPLGPIVSAVEKVQAGVRRRRARRPGKLLQWRDCWEQAVAVYLEVFVTPGERSRPAIISAAERMAELLEVDLPIDLLRHRPRIPGSFRTKDLSHVDLLKLGERFVAAYPDRSQPILIVGLRTAGSYFAAMLHAQLSAQGFTSLVTVTLRPKNGIAPWEAVRLESGAAKGALAVIIDEHPNTGGTFAKTAQLLRRAGFPEERIAILFPVHPAHRDWKQSPSFRSLAGVRVLTIEPEEWHKGRVLEPATAEARLSEYFLDRGYRSVRLMETPAIERWNAELRERTDDYVLTRLKRVYEVSLERADGGRETRYVLAKSVGWGWLSYHAFLAGERLAGFVPPMLGLREGIMYSEWLPQPEPVAPTEEDRRWMVNTVASYVATRMRALRLPEDPSPDCARQHDHMGSWLLTDLLSGAYGRFAMFKAPRIRRQASQTPCPCPALIDGKMDPGDWIQSGSALLKSDFAHHGMGKAELNMTDPACDLADATLRLLLTREEEELLLRRYRSESGDVDVDQRLFPSKLIVAWRDWLTSLAKVADPDYTPRHAEFSRRYIEAWNFLVVQSARHAGWHCRKPKVIRWHSPMVVLDLDGVLDRNVFGFPTTTAAGIRALAVLHAHDVGVAINSARSLWEIKQYCQAYGLVGGVAEYGSALWDAVDNRELVVASAEALEQLEALRGALTAIPGVFLNETYQHSIRAFSYEHSRTVPLPKLLIQDLISGMKLTGLRFQNTNVDTSVMAKGVDKGAGLRALLDWIGLPGLDVSAVGDSAPDLPMFRATKRCYAPAQIWCRPEAERLGCKVVKESYQRGLLSIARLLVHPDGGSCELCLADQPPSPRGLDLFLDMLEVADQTQLSLALDVLRDSSAWEAFKKQ